MHYKFSFRRANRFANRDWDTLCKHHYGPLLICHSASLGVDNSKTLNSVLLSQVDLYYWPNSSAENHRYSTQRRMLCDGYPVMAPFEQHSVRLDHGGDERKNK